MTFRLPRLRTFLFPFLFMLFLYSMARAAFAIANVHAFSQEAPNHLVQAFLHGLRFDVSFLLVWNIPFVLLWCVSWNWLEPRVKLAKRVALVLFLILNLPPLFTNFADAGYFPLSGRRSSLAVLAMWPDFAQQARQLLINYWFVPAATLFVSLLVTFVFWHWLHKRHGHSVVGVWGLCVRLVAVALFLVVGIRASFGVKPLGTWDAFRLPSSNLGALALNTPFTCLKTKVGNRVGVVSHFSSDKLAQEVLRGEHFSGDSHFPRRMRNVVVFILESFSLEFFEKNAQGEVFTPHLRSLAERGFYAEKAFANARSSIQAMPTIFMGIPPFLEEPFVRSSYNGTRVNGLASVLKGFGYQSAFFHGARNGSMYIDTAAKMAGFEKFYGLNEYPNSKKDFDGTWGVFDEPFLKFMAQKISQLKPPFLAGYFSLSSHNPYAIPQQYKERFPKGTHPIHESIGYADFAVHQFMEYAKTQPWYQNTIFVFVADHSVDAVDARYLTNVGRFRVPLVFFDPAGKLPRGRSSGLVQQLDIFPSILDALGIHQRFLKPTIPQFGVSIFDNKSHRSVLVSESGNKTLVFKDAVVRQNDEALGGFDVMRLSADALNAEPGYVPPEVEYKAKQKLRAAMQLFQNGLENNTLVSE
jgi:hypothetical protein